MLKKWILNIEIIFVLKDQNEKRREENVYIVEKKNEKKENESN